MGQGEAKNGDGNIQRAFMRGKKRGLPPAGGEVGVCIVGGRGGGFGGGVSGEHKVGDRKGVKVGALLGLRRRLGGPGVKRGGEET